MVFRFAYALFHIEVFAANQNKVKSIFNFE